MRRFSSKYNELLIAVWFAFITLTGFRSKLNRASTTTTTTTTTTRFHSKESGKLPNKADDAHADADDDHNDDDDDDDDDDDKAIGCTPCNLTLKL
uniref:Uncharacterized protein n=1 Tax=Glossina austeni TaxID=7395 RepID=A0A1A9UT26_GLOAU